MIRTRIIFRFVITSCLVLFCLAWTASATVEIPNGNFDDETPAPWRENHGNTPPGGQIPARTGGGVGGTKCGTVGRVNPRGPGACNPSTIYREFVCPTGQNPYCTVTFKAKCTKGLGETASVGLVTSGGHTSWEIPASTGWVEHKVSKLGCGIESTVNFSLHSLEFLPVNGRLQIDNVSADCTEDDQTTLTQTSGPSQAPNDNALLDAKPIPTLTQWGMIILVVLIVLSTWVVLRRRKAAVSAQ